MLVEQKIPVGLLGATGLVGEALIERLKDHPWFELTEAAGSERSTGTFLPGGLVTCPPDPDGFASPVVFSALPSDAARDSPGPEATVRPREGAARWLRNG